MHIPLYNANGSYRAPAATAQKFETLLGAYADVHVFTGHTHMVYNVDKTAEKNIFEHNSGAICGTWWWTGYETPGVHLGPDGSPGGYRILNVNGTDFKWRFKGTGMPEEVQLRCYDRNNIHITPEKYLPSAGKDYRALLKADIWADEDKNNEVYFNIWDWDPSWDIDVRENGTKLNCTQVSVMDPLHIISYAVKRLNKNSEVSFATEKTSHMFRVKASAPDTPLEIKLTDSFGRSYTTTMNRPMAFDTETYAVR